MRTVQLVYFAGRALAVSLPVGDRCVATDARHVLALTSAIPQVAAAAFEVATTADNPAEVRGLLAAIELMASLCNVLAEGICEASAGDAT
jgi:hypothetical protein